MYAKIGTRVGEIKSIKDKAGNLVIAYEFDNRIPRLINTRLQKMSHELDIDEFEFSRTHWAVKDVELFRILLQNVLLDKRQPVVFDIADVDDIDNSLVSVMMPFKPEFDNVYKALQQISTQHGFQCKRADDIKVDKCVPCAEINAY